MNVQRRTKQGVEEELRIARYDLEEAEDEVHRLEREIEDLETEIKDLPDVLAEIAVWDERCTCGEWITVRRTTSGTVFDGLTSLGIERCPGCAQELSGVFP